MLLNICNRSGNNKCRKYRLHIKGDIEEMINDKLLLPLQQSSFAKFD